MTFADLPHTLQTHFQLCSYAAVSHLVLSLARRFGSLEAALHEFPFLAGYQAELTARGLSWPSVVEADRWWADTLRAWELPIKQHLPLRALRDLAALDHDALMIFITLGLIEEDARFGLLFDALQIGTAQHYPTIGLLATWWPAHFHAQLRQLEQSGVVQIINADSPRSQQMLQVPAPIWAAARGETYEQLTTWAQYCPPERLAALTQLIVTGEVNAQLMHLPALLATGDVQAVVVRGPSHNGRHTVLGALARQLERGVIRIDDARQLDAEHWRMIGSLAALCHALPVFAYDLAPGESITVRALAVQVPLGVIVGPTGGLSGGALEKSITLTLEMPDQAARQRHWQRAARTQPPDQLAALSEHQRLSSGHIYRAAALANARAALNQRSTIDLLDIQLACRTLHGQVLETLATRLDAFGDGSPLAVRDETRRELEELAARCRQRERLPQAVGEAFSTTVNTGVRALFTGPSGTGKTLAARVLAAQLQLDIYRLDLSAVINKYIGETEKNLNHVLSRAEELNVILLIDEGDALLTKRTDVSTANDRYANLETNFLLQRLEVFSGIVIITTNAAERIDGAFRRRMDVVVDFHAPDMAERQLIWQRHLPARHMIEPAMLHEVVARCALTGGQIRNAALHATLLALNNGGYVTDRYLEEAVRREYRQAGTMCPLRPASTVKT